MIQFPAGYQGDVRIKRYLDFYQAGYGVAMLSSGVAFSPLSLFAQGEQGGWYDPSDLTTLFQDAAGTTPVTAVEQPVGLVLDKSRGLATSAELLTNPGPFSATTGWTGSANCVLSTASSRLVATYATTDTFYQAVTVEAGKWYFASATLKRDSGSGTAYMNFRDGTTLAASVVGNWNSTGTTSSSEVTLKATYFAAANGTVYLHFPCAAGATTVVSLSSISVKTIAGNHLSQSTAAARPVLSARVNALTYTEDFSNAAWVKGAGATATASVLSAVAGTGNHWVYRNNAPTGDQIFSVEAKAGTTSWIALGQGNTGAAFNTFFNLSNGTLGTVASGHTASIISVGDGWYLCSVTLNFTTTNASIAITNADNVAVGWNAAGTETINIRKADLRFANAGVGLPAYQRVGAATDYDTTGFPLYLMFDGTDDSLATGTIDPGAVDKAQMFAGVRKLSDASTQMFCEYSTNIGSNTGSLALNRGDYATGLGAYWIHGARGAATLASNQFATTPANYAAPITSVLAGYSDISGDLSVIRVNGTEQATATGDKGSGDWGSYPLYVGRRGGTSYPFSGSLYSLILRFSATNLDAATISSTETWVNQKTLAY